MLTCAHTHTHMCMHKHIHTCTHMHMPPHAHMHTHTPAYTHTGGHAQSGLRGWELLVSQCANCFSLLSPWISQQESDVRIVQAQGGLSEAPLLGLGISILPTLLAPQTFSLSPVHSGLPRGWARAHFSAVSYGVPPYAPPWRWQGFCSFVCDCVSRTGDSAWCLAVCPTIFTERMNECICFQSLAFLASRNPGLVLCFPRPPREQTLQDSWSLTPVSPLETEAWVWGNRSWEFATLDLLGIRRLWIIEEIRMLYAFLTTLRILLKPKILKKG